MDDHPRPHQTRRVLICPRLMPNSLISTLHTPQVPHPHCNLARQINSMLLIHMPEAAAGNRFLVNNHNWDPSLLVLINVYPPHHNAPRIQPTSSNLVPSIGVAPIKGPSFRHCLNVRNRFVSRNEEPIQVK